MPVPEGIVLDFYRVLRPAFQESIAHLKPPVHSIEPKASSMGASQIAMDKSTIANQKSRIFLTLISGAGKEKMEEAEKHLPCRVAD
jgi:hypothetical protein